MRTAKVSPSTVPPDHPHWQRIIPDRQLCHGHTEHHPCDRPVIWKKVVVLNSGMIVTLVRCRSSSCKMRVEQMLKSSCCLLRAV
ncbi:MAG: hypothetical protein HY983_03935 [Candidatus Magasanikbacteria bacterium]|nr:hypothetical protein [Candidatus Magasanikbacteria bacterium]